MKRWTIFVVFVSLIATGPTDEVIGRGGRGGGRGGMSRPHPSAGHSPSMSRPRPHRPTAGQRPSTRPGTSNRPGTRPSIGRPSAGNRSGGGRPVPGNRPGRNELNNFLDLGNRRPSGDAGVGGAAVADFLNHRPERPGKGDRPNRPPNGKRPGTGNRPERPGAGNRPERPGAGNRPGRPDRPDRPRPTVHRPDRPFWHDHPYWARWNWNRPYRWATWGALTTWFPWGWSQPVVYNYGDNVYYDNGTVYYGDEAHCSAEEYADQAQQLATSAPTKVADDTEWMQLGVFALAEDENGSEDVTPKLYLQLAVTKDGVIAGTLYDANSDKTQDVSGMVDKKSQRAAWAIEDKTSPIMETGINNLTKDTAPALLHFDDGQTQQWLLARVDENDLP